MRFHDAISSPVVACSATSNFPRGGRAGGKSSLSRVFIYRGDVLRPYVFSKISLREKFIGSILFFDYLVILQGVR